MARQVVTTAGKRLATVMVQLKPALWRTDGVKISWTSYDLNMSRAQ